MRDRRRGAKSKNYRRSVNVQVVARAREQRIVDVGEAWPGNRNDVVVYRATVTATCREHPPARVLADGAYRGEASVISPRRGPGGRIVCDRAYERFRRRRARAEHVIGELKAFTVLREIRHRDARIDHTIRAVAARHNLKLDVAA